MYHTVKVKSVQTFLSSCHPVNVIVSYCQVIISFISTLPQMDKQTNKQHQDL